MYTNVLKSGQNMVRTEYYKYACLCKGPVKNTAYERTDEKG